MMQPINMPQVGQDIPRARIVEWRKRQGEVVEKGEVVAVVESDKATFEVQAEQAGVLSRIDVAAGEEGAVFKPIAWLDQPGEEKSERTISGEENQGAGSRPSRDPPINISGLVAPLATTPRHQFASPSARRVAREHGVDLKAIQGTGPGGRVQKADVLAAVSEGSRRSSTNSTIHSSDGRVAGLPENPAPADHVILFTRMRRRIAERLTLSQQTIPHFHVFQDVDMTEAQQWRRGFNAAPGNQVTVTDLVIFATSRALAEFRHLNAHVEQDRLLVRRAVNIGVATAVDDGLLVPVIPDTDQKELPEISRLSRINAEAARRGVVDPTVQGTFTVSSLGGFGVPFFLPIINPPECAILAVGAIQPRVEPVPGGIAVRQMTTLALACDHRAVDGAYAARFLGRLKELLETTWRAREGSATSNL